MTDAANAGSTDMWAMADYGPLSERLAPAAELLVSLLGPEPGDRLLDIAAGMGSATVLAVDRGALVTAVDASPAMVARGRERLAHLGEAVAWLEGDVEALPVENGSADLAVSSFGLIFAPHPERALRDVARALGVGGRLAYSAWTPDGVMGRMSRAMMTFVPSPASATAALDTQLGWGDPEVARRRLHDAGFVDVETSPRALPWRFPDAHAMTRFFQEHSPAHAAVAAMAGGRAPDMFAAVEDVFAPGGGPVDVNADYLAVTARRP